MRYRLICFIHVCVSMWMHPMHAWSPSDWFNFGSKSSSTEKEPAEHTTNNHDNPIAPPEGAKPDLEAPQVTTLQNASDAKNPIHECTSMSAPAIADWLNSINIGSFFDYASQYTTRNNQCFVLFDTDQNLSLWAEPYGFNARYHSQAKSKKIDLTLSSFGTSMGASYAIWDNIHVGGGAGYFHSNYHCTKGQSAKINGIYLGPSISYLFSEGSVGFMIAGIGNFYDWKKRKKKHCDPPKNKDQNWDIDMRLEAEYDIHPPADFFIENFTMHPSFRMDYVHVFNPQGSNFLYSKLYMRFEKVIFCHKSGFLTSNINIGWINMAPLSNDALEWKSGNELKRKKTTNFTTPTKNQCSLGFELVGKYHQWLLLGVGYHAALGANSPIQTGKARIEWNW